MASFCVFCGSQSGNDPEFSRAARSLGDALASQGHTLVYGGGSVGLMGDLADQMLANGGEVIGVIPQALAHVELMHTGVADMRIVADMHVRKATMHALADAYIALPGGFGTLEELFEVLCWGQLRFHSAPTAILNISGFYDGLINQLEHMVTADLLNQQHREILYAADTIADLENWLNIALTSRKAKS